jgi:hypothetical protein
MDIYAEAEKIVTLLKTDKIKWDLIYNLTIDDHTYPIIISAYDQTFTHEGNLSYAEAEIGAQLYQYTQPWICICKLPPHQHFPDSQTATQ